MKVCLTCKKELTLDNFYLTSKRDKPYYHPHCIVCDRRRNGINRLSKLKPIKNLKNEVWVKLFNGEYEFSNYCRIKILNKPYSIRLGNPTLANNGYYVFNFNINGKVIKKNIHRLYGELFLPNPNNYPCINHKNGIKTDNRKSNLEWCTYRHNNLHAISTGLRIIPNGEDVWFSKLTNKQALEIFKSKETGVKLAKKYGVSAHCISCIKTGERWSTVTGKKFIKKERHWIEYSGRNMILRDWAKLFKVTHSTLIERLNSNQSFEHIYNYYEKKHNGL